MNTQAPTDNSPDTDMNVQKHAVPLEVGADWIDASFVARGVTDATVTGRTRGHFGMYHDAHRDKWIVIHLPTGRWMELMLKTSKEAEACCALLESVDADWTSSDASSLSKNVTVREMMQRLKDEGPRWVRRDAARRRAIAFNRAVIFDALAAALVTRVTVEFDGYGDNGHIESVTVSGLIGPMELPNSRVVIKRLDSSTDDAVDADEDISEAIKELCYDCLETSHEGWEINDGSFGVFTFDVCCRTIQMIFNGRETVVDTAINEL